LQRKGRLRAAFLLVFIGNKNRPSKEGLFTVRFKLAVPEFFPAPLIYVTGFSFYDCSSGGSEQQSG
jgi:hypothetical protein